MIRQILIALTAAVFLAALMAPASQARVRDNLIYIGIHNYAGQKVFFWIFYRVKLADGLTIWGKERHVLDHRIRKVIGARITRGRLASCRGGIGTQRRDATGKPFETRQVVDICKLYRVRLNSGRTGPTKVHLDFNKQRDDNAYRDPWARQ